MKAILINAKEQTITKVETDGTLQNIYDLLDCQCFTVAHYLENGDCIYVDDEGMFNAEAFFTVEGGHQPFAGNGLIVGTNDDTGETDDCESEATEIYGKVSFPSTAQLLRMIGQ